MNPSEIPYRPFYSPQGCFTMFKLAHAYVPFQQMMALYSPMVALGRGTVFPELDSPYDSEPEYTVDA